LIYRVAFLLEQGIPADRILLLTFTNKAAKEMMRRVADLLGQELDSLWAARSTPSATASCGSTRRFWVFIVTLTILDREDART